MAPTLRRSKRERKQAQSIYADAEKVEDQGRTSATPRKKRKTQRDTVDEDDDDHVDRDEQMEEAEDAEGEDGEDENSEADQGQESEDMDEEEEEESDDEPEEEEYTPVAKAKRKPKNPRSSAKKAPSRGRSSKARKLDLSDDAGDSVPKANKRAPARKAVQTAMSTFAKRFLDESETTESSLIASMLNSYKTDQDEKSHKRKPVGSKETHYTRGLIAAAKGVIDEHNDDPNAAQVSLYNMLFRSVGASYSSLFDPSEVDLESEFEDHMRGVVEGMESLPADSVLLSAEKPTGNAKTLLVIQEYQKIFREFWFQLAATALSDNSAHSDKPEELEKESDDDDDDDSDASDDGMKSHLVPQNYRFQLEMVRDVVKRMIELSCMAARDVRAGASIAVYQLSMAVLEHTVELHGKLKTAQRQLNVAKKSKMKRKAESLQQQVDSWTRLTGDLEGLVTETVMGVFIRRYKDIVPQIRAESMHAMTQFILIRPDLFLKNQFLKYLGWMLSDKSPIVREKAIAGLLAPLRAKSEKKRGSSSGVTKIDTSLMSNICDKFAPRLASCVTDSDITVQERAMELLLAFSHASLLDSVDDEVVWNKINARALARDTSPSVRRDALLFVLEQLPEFDTNVQNESESVDVSRIRSIASWIAHTINQKDAPLSAIPFNRVELVVSSLRACPEHVPLVSNYSAMLSALQQGATSSESPARSRHDVILRHVLIEMLVASVEQEMTSSDTSDLEEIVDEHLLAAQKAQDRNSRSKKKRKPEGSQEKLTAAILAKLAELLESYATETNLLRRLTALPQYFLPSVLGTQSQKKNFSQVLEKISSLFKTSTDETILCNCVLAVTLFAKGEHARSTESFVVLKHDAMSICEHIMKLLEEKGETEDAQQLASIEVGLSQSLRRLNILQKRWDVSRLVRGGDSFVEKLCTGISESIEGDLNNRKFSDEEDEEVPEIWESVPKDIHLLVEESVVAGLSFLYSTTFWAVGDKNLDGEEGDDAATLVAMKNRVVKLISLCFEMYVDERQDIQQYHKSFSRRLQAHAANIACDLRNLFPKTWQDKEDGTLRACALTDDSHLIGGSVRFLRSQEFLMDPSDEIEDVSRRLLLPIARGLCGNWKLGNRREAGAVLNHITGSGGVAAELVSSMSRALKKVEPVRLLEAHMACIRQGFDDWVEAEPEEPHNPTDEAMEELEEAEKAHKEKFKMIEHQAKRLSASLGFAKLSDKSLKPALLGFVREGVRYAFSLDDPSSEEELILGARLPFLNILSKYLNWIRKDNHAVEMIRADFNQREADLRNHPDIKEVMDSDLEAIADFRRAAHLGAFLVEDDDEKTKDDGSEAGASAASGSFRSVVSKTSTQHSLSPLPEEGSDDAKEDDVSP